MNESADLCLPGSEDRASAVIPKQSEERESYFRLVWKKFRKSKVALVGGLMIAVLIILAVFADFFSPSDPLDLNMRSSFYPPQRVHFIDAEGQFHPWPFTYRQVLELDAQTYIPKWTEDTRRRYEIRLLVRSWEYEFLGVRTDWHLYGVEEGGTVYLLGTDKLGRDLWSRAVRAGRISLAMALFATLISVTVGSVLGVVSGYYGGWTDLILQRFVEFVQSFPQLPLWMALAAVIPGTWDSMTVFVIMAVIFSLLTWTFLAREVRGKVMAFRETDFVMAAKEMGASDARIIFLHLFPNCLSHAIVVLTLTIPQIILAESFLSYLGIGIQEPLVSWGVLMRDAQNIQTLGSHQWVMTPVLFIICAVLGFNFLGDGLRDAADPYSIV